MTDHPIPTPLDSDGRRDLREPGFYWVQLGHNPPEIACWQGGEWFLTGNDTPWQPEAVEVLGKRLVMRPGLRVVG